MVARYGTSYHYCAFLGVTKRRGEHIKCRSPNFVGRLVYYQCVWIDLMKMLRKLELDCLKARRSLDFIATVYSLN